MSLASGASGSRFIQGSDVRGPRQAQWLTVGVSHLILDEPDGSHVDVDLVVELMVVEMGWIRIQKEGLLLWL